MVLRGLRFGHTARGLGAHDLQRHRLRPHGRSRREAEIEAVLTNPSGIYNAWIVYYLDDASDRTQIVAEKRCNGTKSVEFSGRIPAQKEGTKVTFQLATLNMAGDLTPSEVCTYTVAAPEE